MKKNRAKAEFFLKSKFNILGEMFLTKIGILRFLNWSENFR